MKTIGILNEGSHDKDPLKILITRIIEFYNPGIVSRPVFITSSTGGSINSKDLIKKVSILNAFGLDYLAVVYDLDGLSGKDKKRKVEHIKRAVIKGLPSTFDPCNIFFGFPEREFEEWLLADEATVKRILGIPGEDVLWNHRDDPKEALNALIDSAYKRHFLDVTEPPSIIYKRIAEECDVKILCSFESFSVFSEQFNQFEE